MSESYEHLFLQSKREVYEFKCLQLAKIILEISRIESKKNPFKFQNK